MNCLRISTSNLTPWTKTSTKKEYLISNSAFILTQRRVVVQILRPPLHQVRPLLQNPLRLLRSNCPSSKTNVTQRYALIDHATCRLAQAQSHTLQYRYQLCTIRIRQS